jgi:outer membrane biosynthesis protein TonB
MKHMTVEEFRAYSEAVARGEIPKKKPAPKPKAQPTPKPKAQPKPKVKARRVAPALLNALERRIDRLERSTITTWAAAVAHIGKRDKVSMAEAGKRAAREYPGLHPARRAK